MATLIQRPELLARIRAALRTSPVAALLGPRQCGKTTLARELAATGAEYLDLEVPASAARLAVPMTALAPLRGLVVIDEVQRYALAKKAEALPLHALLDEIATFRKRKQSAKAHRDN